MDITSQIKEFVSREVIYPGAAVMTYEDYIKTELGIVPSENNETYEADDLISVIAWTNSSNGLQDLLCTTLSGNLSHGVQIQFKDGTLTKLHTHNYIEMAYVVRGRLFQKIMGKSEMFLEGEICLIDRNSIHTDQLFWEDSTVLFIGIEDAFFHQFLQNDSSDIDNIRLLIDRRKSEYTFARYSPKDKAVQTKRTFELILEELLHSYPLKTQIVKKYLERILYLLPIEYRCLITKKEQKELTKTLFQNIKDYIEENYAAVSVRQLASIFNYNPDYLSRFCYQHTGMTLSNYIQKIRIKKALSLLKATDLPVECIAEQVGYKNIGFFYKIFKEEFKTTPNRIRKSYSS